jgi:hypothetical protein
MAAVAQNEDGPAQSSVGGGGRGTAAHYMQLNRHILRKEGERREREKKGEREGGEGKGEREKKRGREGEEEERMCEERVEGGGRGGKKGGRAVYYTHIYSGKR